jgi:hypothetical protein
MLCVMMTHAATTLTIHATAQHRSGGSGPWSSAYALLRCCPDLAWMARRSIPARRGVSAGLLRRRPDRRRICFAVVGCSTSKEARTGLKKYRGIVARGVAVVGDVLYSGALPGVGL